MCNIFIKPGFRLFVTALCLVITVFMSGPARADLTILPTRIIFEGRERFEDITLINTGNEAKTYSMGWEFFRMKEGDGAYLTETQSITDFDLTEHVVFSPRRVTLQPGEKQKIRMALRPPAEIAPGEYRAHFRFKSEKDAPAAAVPNDPNDNKLRAAVNINVGYSIPVSYIVGNSDADGTIESLQLVRNEDVLSAMIPVTRSGGPYALHGHLFVFHQPAGGGAEKLVGEISNAHIFPEIGRRVFDVKLADDTINSGKIRVVYRHFDTGKNLVYDEKTFPAGLAQ